MSILFRLDIERPILYMYPLELLRYGKTNTKIQEHKPLETKCTCKTMETTKNSSRYFWVTNKKYRGRGIRWVEEWRSQYHIFDIKWGENVGPAGWRIIWRSGKKKKLDTEFRIEPACKFEIWQSYGNKTEENFRFQILA